MTIRDLSQYYYLTREIEIDKERLKRLRASAAYPSGDATPSRSGSVGTDRLGRRIADITALEEIIRDKQTSCLSERVRLEQYIAAIPDSLTRQIFTLRFVECRSWSACAARIGRITADAARMICVRYIRKHG